MENKLHPFHQMVAKTIAESREAILRHRLYDSLQTLEHLTGFLEFHVFAVWDFMSLLKALQSRLTCVRTPWVPQGDPLIRRLVNEIVLAEESDTLPDGSAESHFELYLQAMREAGADTRRIESFIHMLEAGQSVPDALDGCGAPEAVQAFVRHTFAVVDRGQPHEIASAFTFGREDLIPELFTQMVHRLERQFPNRLKTLRYYLDRHIQLDGDQHGAIGVRMVNLLCGGVAQREEEACQVAVAALQARLRLWDAIADSLGTMTMT
ncbi:MAG: DUF3050 domain-containing protein [Gemmataceae bacterium]